MDVQHVALAMARGQPNQESDAALPNGGFLDRGLEQVSRPEDALLVTRSEPVRVKQDAVVEDSEQHNSHPHRQVEALDRVGTVAHRVPKVVHGGHLLSRHLREHRLEGFEVAVNIVENGPHR